MAGSDKQRKPQYYVYKTTNKINGKIYVGVHKSSCIENDPYIGSGKTMLKAIKKYGAGAFTREIIDSFDSYEDAFDLEREIVNQDFIERDDTYNIVIGGRGFYFESPEDHPMYGRKHSPEARKNLSKVKKEYFSCSENRKAQSERRKAYCSTPKGKEDVRKAARALWDNPEAVAKHRESQRKAYEPPDVKEKQSKAAKERYQKYGSPNTGKIHTKVVCPHCFKEGGNNAMKRWHFDNCKYKVGGS